MELTPQEIRHALYYGRATDICKRLAEYQEFVLRFVGVCYYGIEYYDGVPDNYLNDAMGYLNSPESVEVDELEQEFRRVMQNMHDLMGKYAFRRLSADGYRRPINKAIYEAWCYAIFYLFPKWTDFLCPTGRMQENCCWAYRTEASNGKVSLILEEKRRST